MQPLTGLFVLDFTTLLPGPLATLMLAEAGAEVLKIEQPGGENARRFPPFVGDESAAFTMLNRGKTSMTLDLKSAAERDKLIPLIKRADILVEQFRPGVMDRLGLGYGELKKINPKLIYCSISGYGQSGPAFTKPATTSIISGIPACSTCSRVRPIDRSCRRC